MQGISAVVYAFTLFRFEGLSVVEMTQSTGLAVYVPAPGATPFQTRVNFSSIDSPKTTQAVTYLLGVSNTTASAFVMIGSSGSPQTFYMEAVEILQPPAAEVVLHIATTPEIDAELEDDWVRVCG